MEGSVGTMVSRTKGAYTGGIVYEAKQERSKLAWSATASRGLTGVTYPTLLLYQKRKKLTFCHKQKFKNE